MKLLIIGNGFDKHCGLKSGFDDFFNVETNKINNFTPYLKSSSIINSINIYYIDQRNNDSLTFLEKYILILKESKIISRFNWADIENHLFELLYGSESYSIDKIADYIIKTNKTDISTLKDVSSESIMLQILTTILKNEMKLYNLSEKDMNHLHDKMYDFIYGDLIKFERRFTLYLLNTLERNNESYNSNVNRLLKRLVSGEVYKVLSFNYTKPNDLINNTEHVHGTLDNFNIIMGIDSTKINHNHKSYRFTKTYRKVEQFVKREKEIVEVLDKWNDEIIFFGHSLNEQDYAYFQTIFDNYDLYNSEIKLKFVYVVFDSNREKEIKETQVKAVIKLIESYGDTLDNKAKGKNLLHMLLNTNRLEIVNFNNLEQVSLLNK